VTGFFLHCMCQVAAQSGEANASSLRQLLGEQRKCMGREAGFGSTRRGAWTSADTSASSTSRVLKDLQSAGNAGEISRR
jgi:hypothetical protein